MHLRGYLIDVTYADDTLTVEGTNKPARIALRGIECDNGPLVIERGQIARTEYREASALVNGRITIHTKDGKKHVLHFRRKSRAEFAELAAVLN